MYAKSFRSALPFVVPFVAAASLGIEEVAEKTVRTADRSAGEVVFVAHRGGIVPGYPENTLAAFRHAIELGVDAIEIDPRGTKDGEIVIMHDATVDRTTNGRGRVEDLALRELKALDAGGGERVPTYEEVLELVAGSGVDLLLDGRPVSPYLPAAPTRAASPQNRSGPIPAYRRPGHRSSAVVRFRTV